MGALRMRELKRHDEVLLWLVFCLLLAGYFLWDGPREAQSCYASTKDMSCDAYSLDGLAGALSPRRYCFWQALCWPSSFRL